MLHHVMGTWLTLAIERNQTTKVLYKANTSALDIEVPVNNEERASRCCAEVRLIDE